MKKTMALLLVIVVLSMSLIGCGTAKTGEISPDENDNDTAQINDSGNAPESDNPDTADADMSKENNIIGQVEAIDGSSITLLIGEMTEGMNNMPDNNRPPSRETSGSDEPDGTPEASSRDEAPPDGGVPGEAPSGEAPSGEAPSGEAPNDRDPGSRGSGIPGFTPGEEHVTIAISENTSITVTGMDENSDGTIEDITVGAILEVTLDQDNTATAVIVRNIMGNGMAPFGGDEADENEE